WGGGGGGGNAEGGGGGGGGGGGRGPRGRGGGGGGDGPAVFVEMVLGHPDLVEPHLVQQLHLLEHPAVELRLWPVQGRDIRWQVVGSKLHTQALVLERCSITKYGTAHAQCTVLRGHLVLRTANYPASLAGGSLAYQARLLRVAPAAYLLRTVLSTRYALVITSVLRQCKSQRRS